jgi:hypothetical protein
MAIARKTHLLHDPWVGIREAARTLGISRHMIMSYGLRGALDTQVVAGRTVVSRDSLERLRGELRKSA